MFVGYLKFLTVLSNKKKNHVDLAVTKGEQSEGEVNKVVKETTLP
jgi:predicted CopG family antitoxin